MSDTKEIVKKFVYFIFRSVKMSPILYYYPLSPPCRSVLLLGRILDINFNLKEINIFEKEQMKSEFIQINPQHTIPTLDDQGFILWDSHCILTYLASAYGKDDTLYPNDVKLRALVDHRLYYNLGTLYQRMIDYFFGTIMMGAPLDETKKAKLAEALYWLETMLKGKIWCANDNFTIADIALCVTVSHIEAFDFDLSPYPRIRTWLDKCKEELEPHGYQEINQTACDTLADLFQSKLQKK